MNLTKHEFNKYCTVRGATKCFYHAFRAQTSHNIDCALGPLCYICKSVSHSNCLTAQLSYEGRAAVEGGK
jgi:hypothetical protein